MKNIALIGMPGCGKSTVAVMEMSHRSKDFQDIIDSDGLENFLDKECGAILSREYSKSVISTGGSAVLRQKAMEHLKKNSTVIFLDVSPQVIKARIRNIKTRGIAAKKNEGIDDIYCKRLPLYRKYADYTLVSDGEGVEASVEKILEILKNEKF